MIYEIITNKIFLSVFIASFICQMWKFIDRSIKEKRLVWSGWVATGGMPSSHSTFVVSLAISTGFVEGFTSSIFFVAGGFAVIVVRDAIGVRHTVDDLTKTVNEIIRAKKLGMKEIWKISGHTPVQAFIGSLVGIVIPVIMHALFIKFGAI